MKCKLCTSRSVKDGVTSNQTQRYRCKSCNLRFQQEYKNKACLPEIDTSIVTLTKEGCGIRSISRIINISRTTVLKRILSISKSIRKPPILLGRTYEVDEMMAFIGNKERRICITYALDRQSKEVVSF